MKVVRVLAVADASVLPGLKRALSPESVELVGVASTQTSVLSQLRRVYPDVVVVDLSLSQTDVFSLIALLAQEHAAAVLALASGEDAASAAERARAAGAHDVVERHAARATWHEDSGSPHVLSLRVLALAAAARPRPSKLSLRVTRLSQPARVAPLSAAGRDESSGRPLSAAGPTSSVPAGAPSSPVSRRPLSAAGPTSSVPAGAPSSPVSRRTLSAAGPTSSVPAGGPSSPLSGRPLSAARSARSEAAPEPPLTAARMSGVPRAGTPRPLLPARVELIAIGASTGGTLALAELLKMMPSSAPPMLVVQHMLAEFTTDFAARLNDACELNVRIAADGELVQPGSVLVAPGARHLRVLRDAEQRVRVRVTDEPPVGKHRPSVDVLFQACAETLGNAVVGVLLTGMGNDGARGLLAMHHRGARTFVQDQASSICFGMPSAAIALGAAQQVLPLREIGHALVELLQTSGSTRV